MNQHVQLFKLDVKALKGLIFSTSPQRANRLARSCAI